MLSIFISSSSLFFVNVTIPFLFNISFTNSSVETFAKVNLTGVHASKYVLVSKIQFIASTTGNSDNTLLLHLLAPLDVPYVPLIFLLLLVFSFQISPFY